MRAVILFVAFCILFGSALFPEPLIPKENIPQNVAAPVREQLERLYSPDLMTRVNAAIKLGAMKEQGQAAVPFLISILENDGAARVRGSAAKALGNIGDKTALRSLANALNDTDSLAGDDAYKALASFGDAAADLLLEAWKSINNNTAYRASRALILIKSDRIAGYFIGLLNDQNQNKRAAFMLGEMKNPKAIEPLLATLNTREKLLLKSSVKAIATIDNPAATEKAVKILMPRLDTGNLQEWKDTIELLTLLGPASAPYIKQGFNSPSVNVRDGAARVMERLHVSSDNLSGDVKSTDPSIRKSTIIGLAGSPWSDRKAVVNLLIECLKDPDAGVREQTVELIRKRDVKEVAENLIVMLKDPNFRVRALTAGALGEIRDNRAVEPIIAILTDEKAFVREKAARALEELTGQSFGQAQDKWQEWWNTNKKTVMEGGTVALYQCKVSKEQIPLLIPESQKGIRNLVEGLYSSDPRERRASAKNLGDQGARAVPAIPFLAGILQDSVVISDRKRRYDTTTPGKEAALALAKIGVPASEFLKSVLNDQNETARQNAVFTLGKMKNIDNVDLLILSLKDISPAVRLNVVKAFGEINDRRVTEPLLPMLNDPDAGVRKETAMVLGILKDPAAVKDLIRALGDSNKEVVSKAAFSLGQIGDKKAADSLLPLLSDSNGEIRLFAANALGELKDARATEALLRLLNDPKTDVRINSAIALGKIGDPKAVGGLISGLKNSDRNVRACCVRALANIRDSRAVEPIIQMLADSSGVALIAADSLAVFQDKRAVEPLIATLNNGNINIRCHSAIALRIFKDKRSIKPLIDLLTEEKPIVKKIYGDSLREITGQQFGDDQQQWLDWWEKNKDSF